jgi:lipoprotein NlpI
MVLYKQGLFQEILKEIGEPDTYPTSYREFMWLQMLIAWLAEDRKPDHLAAKLHAHYQTSGRDYYHSIGRYMMGMMSREALLKLIQTPKQCCEFSYYLGMYERLQNNFAGATHWYHICLETLLQNNGEFHWASTELFWWAHMGRERRHRLLKDDLAAYREIKGEGL